MRIKSSLAICFFVMGIVLSCYSQQNKSQGYGIRAIRGEDYIYINGWDFYSYLSRNNWERLNQIVLMDEDSILINNPNASMSLIKGQAYYGTLCYESSGSKYTTIRSTNIKFCKYIDNYKDKGVIHSIIYQSPGYSDNDEFEHRLDVVSNQLLEIAKTALPQHDSLECILKDGFLYLKNNKTYDVLYYIMAEFDNYFFGSDDPPNTIESGETIQFSLPKEPLLVHFFWQRVDEDERSLRERHMGKDPYWFWYSENPIYHFTKVLFK